MIKQSRWNYIIILSLMCSSKLFAAAFYVPDDSLHIFNVRFETSQNDVLVTYNFLAAEPGNDGTRKSATNSDRQAYKITLVLKKEHDESFSYNPREVIGDIGLGVREGQNKQIRWMLSKEFPRGLEGDDFYFVVLADPIVQKSNIWLWIGGSVAVIGGTVAALLLSRGDGDGPAKEPFPSPPGRPK
ncbi:MAG: hypothetical protein HY276_11315 [Ignavibacteriales bacterium]|nr:hypothetical protein [Ignavibacteriales bacterium]